LESAHDEFTKRGAALVVIAAQKIDGLFKAKEHVRKRNYWFPVLFDENRTVTRAYGVYHAFGLDAYRIAHPATFVVGPGGKTGWIAVSPSQHERPRLEDILEAIEVCDKY
jgi:peroxiredoxin